MAWKQPKSTTISPKNKSKQRQRRNIDKNLREFYEILKLLQTYTYIHTDKYPAQVYWFLAPYIRVITQTYEDYLL